MDRIIRENEQRSFRSFIHGGDIEAASIYASNPQLFPPKNGQLLSSNYARTTRDALFFKK
jgi:hypothetical protein